MSGDATSPARDCLKGEEVDPTGQAKLCEDGKDLTTETVQPSPVVANIPKVGASVNLIMPVIFTLILIAILMWYERRK